MDLALIQIASDLRACLHATATHIYLDKDDPVTTWCPPPFHHLYKDEQGRKALNASVMHLMQKHCNCDTMLAQNE